jgi:hypothetical protein
LFATFDFVKKYKKDETDYFPFWQTPINFMRANPTGSECDPTE